jgi:tRNA/tmRNA/rRNA uracil-C5-methylase (TrmA/RlmC/RlmD family)
MPASDVLGEHPGRARRARAVEGDRHAAADLGERNGRKRRLHPVYQSVERDRLGGRSGARHHIVPDPPRTGLSREALDGGRAPASRLIYVSATLPLSAATRAASSTPATDPRRGVDLFPNTPHVETVVTFDAEI